MTEYQHAAAAAGLLGLPAATYLHQANLFCARPSQTTAEIGWWRIRPIRTLASTRVFFDEMLQNTKEKSEIYYYYYCYYYYDCVRVRTCIVQLG